MALGSKRKRKTSFSFNDRVEVRTEEEGFLGSWHPGTVNSCRGEGWYDVKYDHILVDDGSENLIGQVRAKETDCRGHIRPIPPALEFGEWGLPYGMCVDVYHDECWWEGVIFDHEDGSVQRKVFFPDLGDEMIIHIDLLRITQDWINEVWQRRGTWLFLEFIGEYENENYIPVSINQLWYDLREKEGFQKQLGEWTCSSKAALWKELVLEAIGDNLNLVMCHIFQVIENPIFQSQDVIFSPDDTFVVTPEYYPQAVSEWYQFEHTKGFHKKKYKEADVGNMKLRAKRHLSALGWKFLYLYRQRKREVCYISPAGRRYNSLRQACKDSLNEKASEGICGQIKRASHKKPRTLLKKKYTRPRTLLNWLIDKDKVLPWDKVYYRGRKDMCSLKSGQITRDGITCSCCLHVYSLSGFAVHADSKNIHPAANIFLEDGRSLLECQVQIIRDEKINVVEKQSGRLKGCWHHGQNDYVCSVCLYGGELILCDSCPSSFHKSCLGIEDIPSGDWFCPSCCCRICGQNILKKEAEHSRDGDIFNCMQCERKFHIGCLRNKKTYMLQRDSKGNWFCSRKCELISLGLNELLGQPIPVGGENLTWTLLKSMQFDGEASNIEVFAENYSKLSIGLDVMHECFKPIQEPYTRRDLVKDVIFRKSSELNRLNFRGFYTILLERNDEIITIASVRVYGETVAEIPLVGTRFQYRRLGMCRILMNVLEKKLMELGVQRLVLSTVPSVLNTWTSSFGFSKMSDSERLQFVDYTFLDFPGTVMCHKNLVHCPEFSSSTETLPVGSEDICGSGGYIDPDGSHAVSDIFQADRVGEDGIVEKELVDMPAGNCSNRSECSNLANNKLIQSAYETCVSEISVDCLGEDSMLKKESRDRGNVPTSSKKESNYGDVSDVGVWKCYKRRQLVQGN